MPTKPRTQDAGAAAQVFAHTLPSGMACTWRMPDPFAVIAFSGVLPDPLTAATIKLLVNEGSYVPEEDPRYYHHKAEQVRGKYGLAGAMLVTPRLDVHAAYGDGNGTIGRCEIGQGDVDELYSLFRLGPRSPFIRPAYPDDISRAADAAPDSGNVSPDAGGAAGDH